MQRKTTSLAEVIKCFLLFFLNTSLRQFFNCWLHTKISISLHFCFFNCECRVIILMPTGSTVSSLMLKWFNFARHTSTSRQIITRAISSCKSYHLKPKVSRQVTNWEPVKKWDFFQIQCTWSKIVLIIQLPVQFKKTCSLTFHMTQTFCSLPSTSYNDSDSFR